MLAAVAIWIVIVCVTQLRDRRLCHALPLPLVSRYATAMLAATR